MKAKWIQLVFALLLIATACSKSKSKSSKRCVDQLCTPGEKTCKGNYQAICNADGRSWQLNFCGTHGYCDNGECKEDVCQPNNRFCDSNNLSVICDGRGSSSQQKECTGNTECKNGFCLGKQCSGNKAMCNGYGDVQMVIQCEGGQWKVNYCKADEGCDPDTKTCKKKVCEPFTANCTKDLKESWVCDASGTKWNLYEKCKENEICKDGFCQPIVCKEPENKAEEESDAYDTQEVEDVQMELYRPDIPAAEDVNKLPKNQAVINGEIVKFDVMHSAIYDPTKKQLQITLEAAEDPNKPGHKDHVEIYLTGILEGQTGTFHCGQQKGVTVRIWYKWGKYPQGSECKDFDYTAIDCTVTVTQFGVVGDRIKGSFAAPNMKDCKDSTKSVISNGVFDVYRDQ